MFLSFLNFPLSIKSNLLNISSSSYTTISPSTTDTIYLNIGFRQNVSSYYLSEDTEINTIIDRLKIGHDAFPLNINDETDNLFFYKINDTTVPFIIDQNTRRLKLISNLDREKENKYVFEIELKLKSIYSIKLREEYYCQKNNSSIQFQYTDKYYHKMLISIYVTDINDNIPRCNHFHSQIYLNENEIQKNIFHIHATDPDLGKFPFSFIFSYSNSVHR
jgi:hypothetical protein